MTSAAEKTMEEWADELQSTVGESTPGQTLEVTTTGVRMFARALGYKDRVFYDVEAAKAKGYPNLLSPPGYLGTAIFDPDATEVPGRGPTFPRRLNGGMELDTIAPVFAGDILTTVRTPISVGVRQSKLGMMLIRVSETTFTRQSDGKVVAKRRDTALSY